MITLNTAWGIVQSALESSQEAINVIAGNTANANTPGYTVKHPELEQAAIVWLGNGKSISSGVALAGANSQRDRILNERINQQTQQNASSVARLSALNDVQSVFSTALAAGSSGNAGDVGEAVTNLFNGVAQLAANPTDASVREGVLAAAQSLAESFHRDSDALSAQRTSIDQTASSITDQVNSLTKDIALLNRQIAADSPSGDAGSLEDQRQSDLTNLSKLVGIHQIQTEQNGLTVTTVTGAVLIQGDVANVLSSAQSGGVSHFFKGSTDITADLASGGGQLGGLLTARDSDIPNALQQLDTLAYGVGTAVNAVNTAGLDGNGNPGGNVFQIPASVSGSAAAISVALADPSAIAAAAVGRGNADGSNARAMADLQSEAVVSGATPLGFYSAFLTQLGSHVSGVEADGAAEQASLSQLTDQQSALSSVNLNDQAASLQSFEQAYQAAAKVFSILSTVMVSAINLGTPTTAA